MPASGRHVLDIKKKGPSRAKARGQMVTLFKDREKSHAPEPKMSRPQRLRHRRRIKRIILSGLSVLAVLAFVGSLAGVSHLDSLAIKDVSITGVKYLSPESVSTATHEEITDDGFRLFSHENMFLYPRQSIEKVLSQQFPRIKKVSVARESLLAQAVVVSIVERQPFATWCRDRDGECFVLDETGFIYAEGGLSAQAMEALHTTYVFHGGLIPDEEPIGQWFLRGHARDMVALLDRLASAGFKARGMTVDSEKDFSIRLAEGPVLRVSFDMTADDILGNLKIALEDQALKDRFSTLEYVDLRFGNRVYFK